MLADTIPEACARMVGQPKVDLVNYMLQTRNRGEIASLARLVDQAASQGDVIAQQILCSAACDLAETTHDMADILLINDDETPVLGAGSVQRRSDIYWNAFCGRVSLHVPKARFIRPTHDAVLGVAIAVAMKSGIKVDDFRKRLLTSVNRPQPV